MYGLDLVPYKPTLRDVQHTELYITLLAIGGMYGIPRCGMFYEKVGPKKMKLERFLIPELAKHAIREKIYLAGMDEYDSVDDFRNRQAQDHHAFVACCEELGIEVDDSILDREGYR